MRVFAWANSCPLRPNGEKHGQGHKDVWKQIREGREANGEYDPEGPKLKAQGKK